ncbi:hypothetical protein GCM10023100_53110 [Actinocorallia cavernae]|uniref:Secreted protein n=2 Tax=Actinomycetes TaxID=1760 RepID=A0ABP5Y6P7_9ACTN
MDWEIVPAWAALVVSVGALWVGLKARGDGKRSADAAERSALAAEAALARQVQAEEEAARPRVALLLEHAGGDAYRLCNEGTAPARNIVFQDEELPAVFRLRNTGEVSLNQGEAIELLMTGSMGAPIPPQLFTRWDGQGEWVPVRVPPKR